MCVSWGIINLTVSVIITSLPTVLFRKIPETEIASGIQNIRIADRSGYSRSRGMATILRLQPRMKSMIESRTREGSRSASIRFRALNTEVPD